MSFKLPFLLSLLAILNFAIVHSQSISGKVLSANNEIIPYATIQIGSNYGVITNDEGDFTILTKGFDSNEFVKISCLGFESVQLELSDFTSKDYVLKEYVNELSEVILTNKKLTVEEILLKVQENISSNYSNDFESEIFYRSSSFNTPRKMEFEILKASEIKKSTIKSLNSQFENLRELSENSTSSAYEDVLLNYSHLIDSAKINVIKATKLINEVKDKSTDKLSEHFIKMISKQLDSGSTYKLKTGLFKIEDSLKVGETFSMKKEDSLSKTNSVKNIFENLFDSHAIHEDSQFTFLFNYSKNDYELLGITSFNDEPVYKISFTPKRKSEKFQGVFYVNTSDFAVIKVDYKLGKNRFGDRINLKALVGFKFVENVVQGSVFYKKGESGYYSLQYIKNEKQQYVYFSRPFKFIKNRMPDDDDKTIFKFKFKMEVNIATKEELYFIKSDPNTESTFDLFSNKENYSVEKIKVYQPEIWENYNVITPVEAIKNYHLEE